MSVVGVVLVGTALLVGLVAGYLLRRWHRPVGASPQLAYGEWQVISAGGAPAYHSLSVRGRARGGSQVTAEVLDALQQIRRQRAGAAS